MPRQIFPVEDWTDCTLYHKKSNSCEHVTSKKIYKGSYTSGDLSGKGTRTTADEEGTSSVANSAGRSVDVSTRSYIINT